MKQDMPDFLDKLATDARKTVDKGYYDNFKTGLANSSLRKALLKCHHAPIIAEVKAASPSLGTIRTNIVASKIVRAIEKGGGIGISVLTEPVHFKGSMETLLEARRATGLPILMKDIVISASQLRAASLCGASAVLLIQAIFDRGYGEAGIEEMIDKAQRENLEVLLETHSSSEFQRALESEAALIGINNRDLRTLKVDLKTTRRILNSVNFNGRVIVSESGIKSPIDIRFLHSVGARAFLVGSSIMQADDVETKVRELVTAL